MKRYVEVCFSLFLMASTSTAATLFSVGSPPTAGNPILRIDDQTGSTDVVGNSPVPTLGPSAFDTFGHRLFFGSGNGVTNQTTLFTFDTNTRQLTSVLVAGLYSFFEFDVVTGRLLAVPAPDLPGGPLVAIDPVTGGVTNLFLTNAIVRSKSFDPIGRRLFLSSAASGVTTIWVVDVSAQHVSSFQVTGNFVMLGFDPSTQSLYAIQTSTYIGPLVAIDISNGSIRPLMSSVGPVAGDGAADPMSRVFYARSFNGTTGQTTIFKFDASANTLTTFQVAGALGFLQPALVPLPIPALSEVASFALSLTLALLGLIALRRTAA